LPVPNEELFGTDVHALLESMTDASAIPLVIAQVLRVVGDDEESVEHLANAVESDHALTSRLLRVANSAFYGMSEEIYTVRDAIVLIGFEAVQSLAISAEVVSGVWADDEVFDAKQIWSHSLCCGLFAETYARRTSIIKPDVAFTVGVLHDIGRAIIIQSVPGLFHSAVEKMNGDRLYLWRAEQEVLGFHHGDVGAKLAENWKLPPAYIEAIRCHHEPGQARHDKDLTGLLALANATSHHAFPMKMEGYTCQPLNRHLWEPLRITEEVVRQVLLQKDHIHFRADAFFATAKTH
jgi:putative nucleotidyltransferase with HDIG domain